MKKNPLIVALDVPSKKEALDMVDQLKVYVDFYKIGLQLFLAEGHGVVEAIKDCGVNIFLDLKLHDIPNQVAAACRELVKMEVSMFTVHTQGGFEMMKRAKEAVEDEAFKLGISPPVVLGVTVLTSLDQKDLTDMGINRKVNEQVLGLASMATEAGLDGVVASPNEISDLKRVLGEDNMIVVPGIRPKGAAKTDQKRVMSPQEALTKGADYIVVGRPIIEAIDPLNKTVEILNEIKGVC
ncbi:MAG TPA: orotidine-5'-phosphate decarboxylase [Actinobacteria bacterium]|nr:orotidine-5'-phosphate decarboxylase [Actinomycetota bacterium]